MANYDANIRNYRIPYNTTSTAPAVSPGRRTGQPLERPRVIRKTRKQREAESKRTRALAIRVLAIATAFLVAIGIQIYSHLRVENLSRSIAACQTKLSAVQSENTQLTMQINSNVALSKVDDYAKNTLGMVKVKDYQVNYISTNDQDAVLISGGKSHSGQWHKDMVK